MRKIITSLFLACLAVMVTSCGSSAVNDAKIKLAEKAQVSVEAELVKAFDKYEIQGDCKVEAKKHGEFIYDKVSDLLKVKKEENKSMVMSMVEESVGQTACNFVLEKGLPYLMSKTGDSSKCLKQLGTVKVIEVGKKACAKIKF